LPVIDRQSNDCDMPPADDDDDNTVWSVCVFRVQTEQSLPVNVSLQFNAQFECGNLRKAIQVTSMFQCVAYSVNNDNQW